MPPAPSATATQELEELLPEANAPEQQTPPIAGGLPTFSSVAGKLIQVEGDLKKAGEFVWKVTEAGVDSKLLFLYGADGKCVDQRPASKMKQD